MANLLIIHASQIATPRGTRLLRGKAMNDIAEIKDGSIYVEDGIIKFVGKTNDAVEYLKMQHINNVDRTINAQGKAVIPGFIDSHTHFIFAGYRLNEFCERLGGATYLEIMRHGGGIQSTVNKTRSASTGELFRLGMARLDEMILQGVTTIEGKSGYGLNLETELKQLRVMSELNLAHDVDVVPTYLGAHAIPSEFKTNPDEYVDWMISNVLSVIKKQQLAKFVDVFCDKDVFTNQQAEKILSAAKRLGFQLKIHADEIENLNGAALAVKLGATSADHLLTISDDEIQQIANSTNTVATLLPATAFCLQEPYAPARKIIDANCGVALASDYNPGSAFTCSIPMIIALASMQMQMTPAEILTAMTLNSAAAIDQATSIGSIEVNKKADLQILEYPDYRYLIYKTGMKLKETVIKRGKVVVEE